MTDEEGAIRLLCRLNGIGEPLLYLTDRATFHKSDVDAVLAALSQARAEERERILKLIKDAACENHSNPDLDDPCYDRWETLEDIARAIRGGDG